MARGSVVALVAGVGVLAAWLAGSPGPRVQVPEPGSELPASPSSPFDPVVEQIRAQAGRLERYRATASPPARPSRDPFRFADGRREPPAQAASRVLAALAESRPVAQVPELTLIGIAEDPGPDGPVRTAIISGLGQLFLVGVGQEFGGRFTVVRIDRDAVSVLDQRTQVAATLALR